MPATDRPRKTHQQKMKKILRQAGIEFYQDNAYGWLGRLEIDGSNVAFVFDTQGRLVGLRTKDDCSIVFQRPDR